MSTLDKIKNSGDYLIGKLKRGEPLTDMEHKELAIYNSLYSGKSFNRGQRKTTAKKQRVK